MDIVARTYFQIETPLTPPATLSQTFTSHLRRWGLEWYTKECATSAGKCCLPSTPYTNPQLPLLTISSRSTVKNATSNWKTSFVEGSSQDQKPNWLIALLDFFNFFHLQETVISLKNRGCCSKASKSLQGLTHRDEVDWHSVRWDFFRFHCRKCTFFICCTYVNDIEWWYTYFWYISGKNMLHPSSLQTRVFSQPSQKLWVSSKSLPLLLGIASSM